MLSFSSFLSFFFLDEKEPKSQGETPTPIFFSLEKPPQYRRKNCSSHRFAKTSRTITNICRDA
jgi:hypothetical protein